MDLGPVQLLVVSFDRPDFHGQIADELAKLADANMVRVLDAIVVNKDLDGEVTTIEFSDLSTPEIEEVGAKIGALIGLGAGGIEGAAVGAELGAEAASDGFLLDDLDLVDVLDEVPAGCAAAIALIEHLWAAPLRDAIIDANGTPVVDMWVHPMDLVAIGAEANAD